MTDIFGWTIDHFGLNQAIVYKDCLLARLSSLAAGEAPQGRPCNNLLAGCHDISDMEYYREGKHYIIYRNTEQEIIVLDFIHGSRDLAVLLDDLMDKSDDQNNPT